MAQQTWLCKMLKLRLLSIGSKDFDLSTATPYEQWSPFPPPQYHPLPGFFVGFRFSFSFSVLMSCFSTGMARVLKINICLVAASRLLPFWGFSPDNRRPERWAQCMLTICNRGAGDQTASPVPFMSRFGL